MPNPSPQTCLRYNPEFRAPPPRYQAVHGNHIFPCYSSPQCASPTECSGFQRQQNRYRYGPVLVTTANAEPTAPAPELNFHRPGSQLNSDCASWERARPHREPRGKPPYGEDIPDVFGIVEHLWAPLEWAETYYPTGPVIPTKTNVGVFLPPFRSVTRGAPLGDAKDPQLSHHFNIQNSETYMMFQKASSPRMTSDITFTSTAPPSSTAFWKMAPLNTEFPSNITSPAAYSSASGSSILTWPKEIMVTNLKHPHTLTSRRTGMKVPTWSPQMIPRWQRLRLEERDYPSWYDIHGVNTYCRLNGPSVG